ncbi:hypothetical protein QSJ18_09570 [Gordonia sp. ABSL1-1]|uniref:hypothetical protein n=1 Tax=Gordonia sp. ABSL1-1 TaxID=3053923 RepID=UPI002572E759|nr:hypothetical protein [Gordonia sp. ABSL1-1]MDL9936988.1 hypothetical protein [Gordonia sp. ABSL1-1]
MFRFDWLARALLAAVAMMAFVGVVSGCGTAEESAPPGAPLPADFPTSEVPLIDGTVLSATGDADHGWIVTMQGPANGGNQLDAAVTKLTDDGYEVNSRDDAGAERTATLTARKGDTTFTVVVGVSPQAAGGTASVIYQVSAR